MRRKFFLLGLIAICMLAAGGTYYFQQDKILALLNKKQPVCFSDNLLFPAFCHDVIKDDSLFKNFKQKPLYNIFCEYTSFDEGKNYLEWIESNEPLILEKCDHFRQNDAIGSPRIFDYGKIGAFSPSTLGYMKIAADLKKRFGSLDGFNILQIGGGYGGQCKILCDLFQIKSYTIVDLPECLELAKKVLDRQGITSVIYVKSEEFSRLGEYDLVLSDFDFSEMDRTIQRKYIDKVFSRIPRGYLLCHPGHWKQIPYSKQEHTRVTPLAKELLLKNMRSVGLKKVDIEEEMPATGKDNFLLTWDKITGYAI